MMNIPKYTESFDPGFAELNPTDFAVEKVTELKKQIITEISVEFARLKVEKPQQEYLCYTQVGTTKLEMIPDFNLMMFRDYLRRLVAVEE